MGASAEEYAAFQEKVKKTVYIDNLSPSVTDVVLKAAFDQFCNVVNIQFIPNYMNPHTLARAALVEMRTEKEATDIIDEMAISPLMICGMPRPVRACAAEEGMFDGHPKKPDRRINFQWLDPEDPNFEVATKIKNLIRKHAAEAEFLLKNQSEEEEKLANQQAETLKANYKKYELVDGVLTDGTATKLAHRYRMRLLDA